METLEQRLIENARKGEKLDIETALLVASGISDENKIAEYKGKISDIDGRFNAYCKVKSLKADTPLKKAIALHRFFYETKPRRAKPADCAASRENIAEAIDAELSMRNEPFGGCVSLTALYTVIALRNGLDVYVLANPKHVLSRVKCNGKDYDIENTKRDGIGKRGGESYSERNPESIVASVYANNAYVSLNEKRYDNAISECTKAIAFDRKDPAIYLNRGSAKMKKGEFKSAWLDFRVALEIDPEYKLASKALKIAEKMIAKREENGRRISFGAGQNCDASDANRVSYGPEQKKSANDRRIAYI